MSAEEHWDRDTSKNYWDALPEEERERLDGIARDSILELTKFPRDHQLILEVLAWQRLEVDVLEAHGAWLSRTKAKFEARGIEWTVDNLNHRSRLWEHE